MVLSMRPTQHVVSSGSMDFEQLATHLHSKGFQPSAT